MLLSLSLGTTIGILPFTIYRAIQQDWAVAILDLIVMIIMTAVFLYIYISNNVRIASLVLILGALICNVISFYLKGVSQVNWIFPAMLSAYYVMSHKKALLINFVMLSFYIPKLVQSLDTIHLSTILVTIIITNMIAYVFASGLRKQEIMLTKLASEDYLTGTGNRRALNAKLDEIHTKLKNHDKTASMILLDLDHFKRINDKYGHIKGDQVLVELSDLLKNYYSNKDKIFRYGGEEFLIICPNTSSEMAFKKAQEFKELVKKKLQIDKIEQTISLGVAEYSKEESIADWIHRVDLALYQAKNQGRDRVIKA